MKYNIPVGKNKTITVEPLGALRVGVEKSNAKMWMKKGFTR